MKGLTEACYGQGHKDSVKIFTRRNRFTISEVHLSAGQPAVPEAPL